MTITKDISVGAELDNPFLEVREVGPSGGTVDSSDGRLTLKIPEGALSRGVEITVEAIEAGMLGAEFDEVAAEIGIAAAYRFGPSGLAFDDCQNLPRATPGSGPGGTHRSDVYRPDGAASRTGERRS